MRLELLGGLRAVEGKTVVTRFRTHRSASLLAYVALHSKRDHSRDALGELLWPDEDSEKQRSRLRYELSVLRAALGWDPFRADGNATLALAPDVSCDVSDFEAEQLEVIRAGTPEKRLPHLRKAAALCRGELLPGVYEAWATEAQERFREAHFDILTRLIVDLETLGRYEEARAVRRDAAARFPDAALPEPPAPVTPGYLGTLERTPFFGREAEIQSVRDWLKRPGASRLLTLTGMGGIGKSRLMTEAARETDAVFIPLAEATQADQLWGAIATALNLTLSVGVSPRMAIFRAVRERGKLVLLLDNLEQLFPDIAPLLQEMLDACPALRCLATSRRPLQIPAEREFPLDSLPDKDATSLFLERARRARPGFAATERGEAMAQEIAHLLEGVPLSLELAAARAIVLGPTQIREQLNERLTFLVQIRSGADKRHNSLRAALEWSVALLSPERRRTLGQIAVFRDGFSLDAAQTVCGNDPPVLDALEDLMLHSLLGVAFDDSEEARYVLRGVIRDFAEELLNAEEGRTAREHHLAYFLEISARLHSAFHSPEWQDKGNLFRRERENLRQAQTFAIAENKADALLRLCESMAIIWFESGERDEFRALMTAVEPLLRDAPPTPRLVRFLGLCAADARRTGDMEASWEFWERRLSVARTLNDTETISNSLMELVGQAIDQRKFAEARSYLAQFKEATAALTTGDIDLHTLILEARLAWKEGCREEALTKADAAFALLSAIGERPARLYAMTYLARIYRELEGGDRAERLLHETIEIARANDSMFVLGSLTLELARHRRAQGRRLEAERAYRIAIGVNSETSSRLREESVAEYREYKRVSGGDAEIEFAPWRSLINDIWERKE